MVGAIGEPRYARVSLSEGIPMVARSFYVDIVRRAAEAGLAVERNAQTSMLATKFGAIESAAVTLAGPTEQNCQAFRFLDGETGFGFQGWLCGSDSQPVETKPACLLHRRACSDRTRRSHRQGAVRGLGEKPPEHLPAAGSHRIGGRAHRD